MKLFQTSIIACLCLARLHALESAEIVAVAKQFDLPSGDEQYEARAELNRLVAEASVPGKGDPAAVAKLLVTVLEAPETSKEARKYMLRALARVGNVDSVEPLAKILLGPDAMLREEAREALSWIRDPKAAAVLEAALAKSPGKPQKAGLIQALGNQGAASSVALLAPFTVDADADLAAAALLAISRIGGPAGIDVLTKASASPKLAPTLKPEAGRALLHASAGDPRVAAGIYQSSPSPVVKLAAFLAVVRGAEPGAKPALIEAALKSDDADLRQAALASGLEANLPSLVSGLAASMDRMSMEDRLIVLANLHFLKPTEVSEKVALGCITAEAEDERISAIGALGAIATKGAFDAVLQALGAREPRVNQAAANALAAMRYPAAESTLLGMLKNGSPAEKVLAVKVMAFRQVPDSGVVLLGVIQGADDAAAKEAMKTLYFTASLDDLRNLCTAVAAADPASQAGLRGGMISIAKRIATRLNTPEASELVKPWETAN